MTHPNTPPALEELNRLFVYDPFSGLLFWNPATKHRLKKAGKIAGYQRKDGYRIAEVKGRKYYVHRLVYAMYYGVNPGKLDVDHINGYPGDNRISNLRLASRKQNLLNQRKTLTDGGNLVKGVRQRYNGKWEARVYQRGDQIYLGSFDTRAEAEAAYAEVKLADGDIGFFPPLVREGLLAAVETRAS